VFAHVKAGKLVLTQVRQISGAPILGRHLTFPANVKPSWKGLTVKNALAYLSGTSVTSKQVL
jgi:hypothetical protein